MNNEHKNEKITKNQNDTESIDDLFDNLFNDSFNDLFDDSFKNSEFNFSGKNFIEKVDTLTIFNLYVEHPKERNK